MNTLEKEASLLNQTSNSHKFDLEDRTTEFAKRVIRLCKELPKNSMNNRLIG